MKNLSNNSTFELSTIDLVQIRGGSPASDGFWYIVGRTARFLADSFSANNSYGAAGIGL